MFSRLDHLAIVVPGMAAALLIGRDKFGLNVAETAEALAAHSLAAGEPRPHQGTLGKRALFLERCGTQGVQVELTGK